jgi:DNA-directed RNA polymerase subunit L
MKFDINLKVKKYNPRKDYNSSSLCVEFTGKDVYYKLINGIGRVASNGIPSYAFHPQLIMIEENTCPAYDNQYLQLRLSSLPIYDLPLDLIYLNDKFWKSYPYYDLHREKHPKEQEVKAYVNYHNNSNEIKFVTTNDLTLYVDGVPYNTYNKEYPILLIKLRPNDTFKCNMTACIGIGEAHTIFKSSVNSYATYTDTNYELNLQSNGQETEYVTLIKSCKHIVKRFEDIKSQLETRVKTKELKNDKIILLTIDNEDHTIGEILNYELQNNENLFSAVSKPNHLIKSVLFKIESLKPEKILDDIFLTLDIIIEKMKYITELAEKLSR